MKTLYALIATHCRARIQKKALLRRNLNALVEVGVKQLSPVKRALRKLQIHSVGT